MTRTRSDVTCRPTLLAAAVLLAVVPLASCGQEAPAAPAPGEASTGVPLNVGSEDPAATATEAVP